jgi:hypothetical protein
LVLGASLVLGIWNLVISHFGIRQQREDGAENFIDANALHARVRDSAAGR